MDRLFLEGATPPRLRGQKCTVCNHVAFPPNPYGCEVCGAPKLALAEHPLAGEGRLKAFATTFIAPRKEMELPFTVASIALKDGLVIRALMAAPTDETLNIGDAVQSVLVTKNAGPELRFTLAEKA